MPVRDQVVFADQYFEAVRINHVLAHWHATDQRRKCGCADQG